MAEIIITPDHFDTHKIVKYEFKNFDAGVMPQKDGASILAENLPRPTVSHTLAAAARQQRHEHSPSSSLPKFETAVNSAGLGGSPEEPKISLTREALDEIRATQAAENSLVADLVKKVEGFANSVVTLESRLEKQEADFAARLETETKRAFEDGRREGEQAASGAMIAEIAEHKAQLKESIAKIDKALQDFGEHTASLEKELSSVAIEIAREVIAVEAGENSANIAKALSQALLAEVKDALKITIKVSPDEEAELSEFFKGDSRVTIISDRAISRGGVVLVSDAGSIDAQIPNRFAAIRKSILESR
ncbi:MAG: hypothetical protein LBU73_09365 [Helicobacteraceae bacterium]|jgi:flagellar assembly protein FliH|nr:hypothetical protein [Helicobacteraceae bacterium]